MDSGEEDDVVYMDDEEIQQMDEAADNQDYQIVYEYGPPGGEDNDF
jgi:hypothetical protein